MADATPNTPGMPPVATNKSASSLVGGLVIPLLLILAAAGVFAIFYFLNKKSPPEDILGGYAYAAEKYGNLNMEKFKDDNGDLIADTPADAKTPTELYFCEIPGPNPERSEETWAAFLTHMTQATGLPCKYRKKLDTPAEPSESRDDRGEEGASGYDPSLNSLDKQLEALESGQLHITAFSTGQVRQAVNTAGFRPLVVPADKDGNFTYQVKVLVAAASPAKGIADLRGKRLAVTAMSSNSGAKAPFVLFHDLFKMTPPKDYTIVRSGRYETALAQVVNGEADAACIASDLLARELAREELSEDVKKRGWVKLTRDKIKELYTFEQQYPKLCFGVSHTLPEPLVEKILAGFTSFQFEGNAVGEKYRSDGVVRFQPVDYKKDWQSVREVDDRLAAIAKGEK